MFPGPSQPGPALASQLYLPLFSYIPGTLNSSLVPAPISHFLLFSTAGIRPKKGKNAEPSSRQPPPISTYPVRLTSKWGHLIHLCPSLPVTINNPFSPLIPCVTLSIAFRALSTFSFVWPFRRQSTSGSF